MKICVIGGGMTGISTVHHILELIPSAHITLIEKEKKLGGNARTVSVKNSDGKKINVDAGPQYFSAGPWDNYIKLLKFYGLYNSEDISNFFGSFVVDSNSQKSPDFISPMGKSLRGEKISSLLHFNTFFSAARKIYLDKDKNYPIEVENWVENLRIKDEFKKKVIFPFLASVLGTTVEEIKKISTREIVKLFAFRNALQKSVFKVLNKGMGNAVIEIGKKLEQKNVKIIFSEVMKIERNPQFLTLKEGERLPFDWVVFATHPYHASSILKSDSHFTNLVDVLNKFTYFSTHVILHSHSAFVNLEKPTFFNIRTKKNSGEMISNTMNLKMIHPRFKGIYKSWLDEKSITLVKNNATFLHSEKFKHPFITPEFSKNVTQLKKLSFTLPYLHFAGAWTEGVETQETAVISGKLAAEYILTL